MTNMRWRVVILSCSLIAILLATVQRKEQIATDSSHRVAANIAESIAEPIGRVTIDQQILRLKSGQFRDGGTHRFVVINVGAGPLRIVPGPSIRLRVSDHSENLKPFEVGHITVRWLEPISSVATPPTYGIIELYTNDPTCRKLVLAVVEDADKGPPAVGVWCKNSNEG